MPSLRLNSSNGPREIGCAIRSLSDCARTRILEAWSRSKPASLEYLPFSWIQKQSGNHVPQADSIPISLSKMFLLINRWVKRNLRGGLLRTLVVDRDEVSHRRVDQREVHRGELDIALCVEANEEYSFLKADAVAREEADDLLRSRLENDVLFPFRDALREVLCNRTSNNVGKTEQIVHFDASPLEGQSSAQQRVGHSGA